MTAEIPVIDFSLFETNPRQCAEEIREASERIGFFYLCNHGIPQEHIDGVFEQVRALFSSGIRPKFTHVSIRQAKVYFSLPPEEKLLHAISENNFGYSAMHQEVLDPDTQKKGDFKELVLGSRIWF